MFSSLLLLSFTTLLQTWCYLFGVDVGVVETGIAGLSFFIFDAVLVVVVAACRHCVSFKWYG